MKKSKKGKKKAADMDAIFAALNGDTDAAAMDAQTNGLQHEEQEDPLAPPGELSHSVGYLMQFRLGVSSLGALATNEPIQVCMHYHGCAVASWAGS